MDGWGGQRWGWGRGGHVVWVKGEDGGRERRDGVVGGYRVIET